MNILFIDHECHAKTHSADFFLDIVRPGNEIRILYYKKAYNCIVQQKDKEWADVVIIWEFLISRKVIGVQGKPCIFVPMYDNEWGSYWQWRRIARSGMAVISFCDKLSKHARRCGVSEILDVRYAFDPLSLPQEPGDSRLVFLWERGEIDQNKIKTIFPPEDGWKFDVKLDDDFLSRDEYFHRIAKCGVFVAPRRKEGIGMAFLEAIAMGKCVVAHNDATMNEYITNGVNGLLVDFKNPRNISVNEVNAVRKTVVGNAKQLYSQWQVDKEKIMPFVRNCANGAVMCRDRRISDALAYLAFLAEGALMRIKECVEY